LSVEHRTGALENAFPADTYSENFQNSQNFEEDASRERQSQENEQYDSEGDFISEETVSEDDQREHFEESQSGFEDEDMREHDQKKLGNDLTQTNQDEFNRDYRDEVHNEEGFDGDNMEFHEEGSLDSSLESTHSKEDVSGPFQNEERQDRFSGTEIQRPEKSSSSTRNSRFRRVNNNPKNGRNGRDGQLIRMMRNDNKINRGNGDIRRRNKGPKRSRSVKRRRVPVEKDLDGDGKSDVFGERVQTEVIESFEDSFDSGNQPINGHSSNGFTRKSRSTRRSRSSRKSSTNLLGSARG
jgi:hypothetical protein